MANGRSRRRVASRAGQAEIRTKNRDFDPVAVLRASAAGRVRQLLPVKYKRMSAGPFAFFRGAVSIMAADLARLPESGLLVQLCGDAHLQNLGCFAAPDGRLVFDLNDFDETIRGPWEWDLKRMAVSIVLAGRESDHSDRSCSAAADACLETYCRAITDFARAPILDVARHQIRREATAKPIHAALRQAERTRPLDLMTKLAETKGEGCPRFRDKRPDSWRVHGAAAQRVLEAIAPYRETLAPERRRLFDLFRPIDVGFKVAGTGSVGLRNYVVLFEGNGPDDPMFLQFKQEVASAYARYLRAEPETHHGRRVVEGQRAIQPQSDLMLGWTTIGSHSYLVRQLADHKGSIDPKSLRAEGLNQLARVAGELLARGHARSGDACEIAGYCGSGEKLCTALRKFATAYADQTEADFEAFGKAMKAGTIKVEGTNAV